jgi:hypothetical protein
MTDQMDKIIRELIEWNSYVHPKLGYLFLHFIMSDIHLP